MQNDVQLVVSGGIRSGADVAKALALGATAGYAALGTVPGRCHHCHTGMCPVGVTSQDSELTQRLDPETGARWMTNYLKALTMAQVPLAGTNWIPGHPGR